VRRDVICPNCGQCETGRGVNVRRAEEYATQDSRHIAKAICAKPSQVALAWLLGKGDFIVPIPGTKRRAYLEENAGAVDVKLSDDDMARLEAALRPEAVSGTRYNEKLMAWVDR
jgi:aryl-alcohol dehydrogenase-like predicted oxidoreductase